MPHNKKSSLDISDMKLDSGFVNNSLRMFCPVVEMGREISPGNLAFDLSLIAFYDFIFVSCLSCLEVCPNESLPKSDDRNMFKFAFEI